METINIEQVWKSGKGKIEKQPVPDLEKVRKLSGKNIRTSKIVMLFYLGVYLLMLAATILIECLNLSGYRGNSAMMEVHSGVLAVSVFFTGYGIFLIRKIVKMDRSSDELTTSLKKRIIFFQVHYEVWLWIVAFTTLLLTFSINSWVDNDQGHYRVNNIALYAILEGGIFIFVYLMMKLAHYPLVKELRSHLSDIERQTSESTDRFENQKKKWRWWAVAGMLIIMALLACVAIAGILKYA